MIAMLLGSIMLYDSPDVTGIRLSWFVIVPTVGATAALVFFAVTMGIRALYRPSVTGSSAMAARLGVTRTPLHPDAQVPIDDHLCPPVTPNPRLPPPHPA